MRQHAEKKINRKAAIFVPASANAENKTGEGKTTGRNVNLHLETSAVKQTGWVGWYQNFPF